MKSRSGNFSGSSKNSKRRQKQKLIKQPIIKGPEVLRSKWDNKKTVRQNYTALGLVPDLSLRPSGGQDDQLRPIESKKKGQLAQGLGRIVRDEEGNVIDIIEGGQQEERDTPWGQSMNGWEDVDGQEEDSEEEEESSELVQALENLPQPKPLARHVSELEAVWLLSLVEKHDEDLNAMAMDKRLNENQKTKGEIKNRINRAGGFDALREAIRYRDLKNE
ncbi:unnamed protein product [Sympodiomycopsis kandeliae]